MTISRGRAPQLNDKNAYSNQVQWLDVRRTLDSLRRDVDILRASVVLVQLSVNDTADFFDPTGLGKAIKRYAGWAISNGRNGTVDYTATVPAGLTPVVRLLSPTQVE
jgi:hypothetical protein